MLKILVTGSNGQLASCIKEMSTEYTNRLTFFFKSFLELDITDEKAVFEEFEKGDYQYCINCAAFTNVDGAEKDADLADAVNRQGPKNLAKACSQYNIILIHISTDFVFDGTQSTPYSENDITQALSVYGKTKLLGEQEIASACNTFFIIRTSWLYSEYGHNFMKSMIKFGREREAISVVYDQIGAPTYAKDLAGIVLLFIITENTNYGVYHYSNEGVASWYDFAKIIFEINNLPIVLHPIRTEQYPLPAKRPSYSVLDKAKIKEVLQIKIPHWRDSLLKANKAFHNNL